MAVGAYPATVPLRSMGGACDVFESEGIAKGEGSARFHIGTNFGLGWCGGADSAPVRRGRGRGGGGCCCIGEKLETICFTALGSEP